jgi:hypothetical protein
VSKGKISYQPKDEHVQGYDEDFADGNVKGSVSSGEEDACAMFKV